MPNITQYWQEVADKVKELHVKYGSIYPESFSADKPESKKEKLGAYLDAAKYGVMLEGPVGVAGITLLGNKNNLDNALTRTGKESVLEITNPVTAEFAEWYVTHLQGLINKTYTPDEKGETFQKGFFRSSFKAEFEAKFDENKAKWTKTVADLTKGIAAYRSAPSVPVPAAAAQLPQFTP